MISLERNPRVPIPGLNRHPFVQGHGRALLKPLFMPLRIPESYLYLFVNWIQQTCKESEANRQEVIPPLISPPSSRLDRFRSSRDEDAMVTVLSILAFFFILRSSGNVFLKELQIIKGKSSTFIAAKCDILFS